MWKSLSMTLKMWTSLWVRWLKIGNARQIWLEYIK